MSTPSSIMNIPVLTEIIAPSPVVEAPAGQPASSPPAEAVPVPALSDFAHSRREWDDLERRLTANILQMVQERVGFILAHAIKDSLAAVLQKATEELAAEIRTDLHSTLEVVVSLAVSQEIARLQQGEANMTDNMKPTT